MEYRHANVPPYADRTYGWCMVACRPSQRGSGEWFSRPQHQVMEHGHANVPPYADRTYGCGRVACRPPEWGSSEWFIRQEYQAMEIDHMLLLFRVLLK